MPIGQIHPDWWGAQAFVGYLNSINYGGSKQWSLPSTPDNDSSIGIYKTNSQLGELYYNELGGIVGYPIPENSLFSHEVDGYWSSNDSISNPYQGWIFDTSNGGQTRGLKDYQLYAWAVSPGNLNSSVPEPGIIWLLGSGFLGLLGLKRHKQ